MTLRDRHAIVTGGGRGIGAAIATRLAEAGANVTIVGRTKGSLDAHAKRLARKLGVKVHAVVCDVAQPKSVDKAFDAARKKLGDVHILVNNAGQAEAGTVVGTSLELWNRLLAVNLTGAFLCMRQVMGDMMARGKGRIVNVASISGLKAYQNVAAYTASKHGLIGLTRVAAAESAKAGVTVNAVCPGYTDTDMVTVAVKNLMAAGRTKDEAHKMILRTIPRGRLITPDEVAATVAWLCSDEASAVSGQAIMIAGGEP